jgi:hypothetical protein
MAKADTVYSMFGMKTPQQVAQEQLKRQQAFITRSARDPYQLAGASLGVALGRLLSLVLRLRKKPQSVAWLHSMKYKC